MMFKPNKTTPALYAGILIGFVSAIPFINFINCFCCAGILGGGVLAVFFYKQHFTPEMPPLTSGDCLAVGALAGIVGAVVSSVLSLIVSVLFGNVLSHIIYDWMGKYNLNVPGNEMDTLHSLMDESFTVVSFLWSLIASLFIYPLFGLLGGLIGWGIFKPKPFENLMRNNVQLQVPSQSNAPAAPEQQSPNDEIPLQ